VLKQAFISVLESKLSLFALVRSQIKKERRIELRKVKIVEERLLSGEELRRAEDQALLKHRKPSLYGQKHSRNAHHPDAIKKQLRGERTNPRL